MLTTGGFDKLTTGGFDKLTTGGFDKLTAGGFDKLTAGGFDKLTAGGALNKMSVWVEKRPPVKPGAKYNLHHWLCSWWRGVGVKVW